MKKISAYPLTTGGGFCKIYPSEHAAIAGSFIF
jgi:hypothetical protein